MSRSARKSQGLGNHKRVHYTSITNSWRKHNPRVARALRWHYSGIARGLPGLQIAQALHGQCAGIAQAWQGCYTSITRALHMRFTWIICAVRSVTGQYQEQYRGLCMCTARALHGHLRKRQLACTTLACSQSLHVLHTCTTCAAHVRCITRALHVQRTCAHAWHGHHTRLERRSARALHVHYTRKFICTTRTFPMNVTCMSHALNVHFSCIHMYLPAQALRVPYTSITFTRHTRYTSQAARVQHA